MRRRLVIVVSLVLLVTGLAWWFFADPSEAPEGEAASGPSAQDRRAALIGRKMAARAGGEVALDPVVAKGRVTDAADGKPIAGAIVLLSPKGLDGGQAREPGTNPEPLVARTDAGGRWHIEHVRPGRFTLSASADGYFPGINRDVRLHSGADNPDLLLNLVAGGQALTGRVTDIGGGPIEGAVVSVVRLDEGNLLDFGRAPSAALTDDDGGYRMHLADGVYVGVVQHPDYKAAQESFEIDAGPRTVDYQLVPGSEVEGFVRVRGTEAPVAGAIVAWRSPQTTGTGFSLAGFGEGRVFTDDKGRFHLRGLGSGVFHLHAVADGFATRQGVEVPLGVADHQDEVVLYVDPAYKISGFVVGRDDEEQGLEGVWLGALSMKPPGLVVAKAPSESDGYFEILGVQPGNYMIGAIGEDALPNITGTGAQVTDHDVTDVLVVMDPGVSVRGRVDPPMAANVSVTFQAEDASLSSIMGSITNAFVRARSDAEDGTFELRPVSPGKLKLVAEAEDGSKGEVVVDVTDEGIADVVIALEPRPVLAGRVVDDRRQPVTDAHVYVQAVSSDESISFSFSGGGANIFGEGAPTREDGSFLIKGIDPGTHRLSVKVRSGQEPLAWAVPDDPEDPTKPLEIEVPESGRQELELRVETRSGVIEGVVLGEDGPVADAWVRAIRKDATKEFLRGIRQARGDGGQPEAAAEAASEDDDGNAEEKEGAGAEADTALSELGSTKPVLTDERGRFTVANLRAGEYTVVAEGDRGGSRGRVAGVTPDARVTVRLDPLAGVEGRVTAKGSPVERYTIGFTGASNRSTTIYDTEGKYRVTRLDPGKYKVKVDGDEGVADAEIEIGAGEIETLDIEVDAFGRLRGKVVDQASGEGIGGLAILVEAERGGVDTGSAMSMLLGQGPTTANDGAFELDRVPPGAGKLRFVDRDAIAEGGGVANASYTVEPGQEEDLGTITGIRRSDIPVDERGELGLRTTVKAWTARPRTTGGEREDEEPPADPERERLWIAGVQAEGPAAEAGVLRGDEVLAIDGRDVAGLGPETASALLSSARVRAGDDVSIEIARGGSHERITIRARPKKRAPG